MLWSARGALTGSLKSECSAFDGGFDVLLGVKNILLDELERTRSMGELVIELVCEASFLQHPLFFS